MDFHIFETNRFILRASAVAIIQRTDNAVGIWIFTFLRRIVPNVASRTGTFGVFSVASFADSDLVGAGAGEGEAEFGAKLLLYFRLGFEASPFVAKWAFDPAAAGARGFSITQSRAVLGCYALGKS